MAIKHRIKFKNDDRARGTRPAELRSSGPKHSAERPASKLGVEGESIRRDVPDNDRSVFKDKKISDDYKSGGAYKAMLDMFADHLSDQEYAEHCRKFFKGDNENNS